MKIKWMVQGLACSSVLFCSTIAAAADTLLAQVPLQLTAEQTVTAELWGDRLSNGYANDLLVMIKDKDKKLLTAHAPSIKGDIIASCSLLSCGRAKAPDSSCW